jgi:hypothetical protein
VDQEFNHEVRAAEQRCARLLKDLNSAGQQAVQDVPAAVRKRVRAGVLGQGGAGIGIGRVVGNYSKAKTENV